MDKPISYKGTQPYIFISYAHKDSDAVWPIIARMQGDGYRVWYDDGIDPGTEWDENIANHVEGCGYFIAFLSPAYLESENCRDELNFARDLGKERLLIYLSDVPLPAGMRMRLSRLQAIHWYTYENEGKAFSKLYEAKGLDTCRGKEDQASAPVSEAPMIAPAAKSTGSQANQRRINDNSKGFSQSKVDAAVLQQYRKAAEQGDVDALQQYRKAAEQGNVDAQYNLGVMYSNGIGVPQDKSEAAQWYRKAAEQGDADAQNVLGSMYYYGEGVPRDNEEAIRWYRKAVEQGHSGAQNNLGVMYFNGDGVPQDKAEALRWYQKAAEQGNVKAQFNLGMMYLNGDGVRRSQEEARQWLQKAADQGHEKAKAFLSEHF